MKVGVLFFAGAREAVGGKTLEISVPPGSTVEGLLRYLGDEYPGFAHVSSVAQTAVNEEYAPKTYALQDGD